MPRSPLYQLRVPPVARHLFGGVDRLRARFETPELAETWLAKARTQIAEAVAAAKLGRQAQRAAVDISPDVTLRVAAHSWIQDRPLAPRTRRWYREHLDAHVMAPLGDLPLSAIGRARLAQHLADRLRAGASKLNAGRDVLMVQAVVRYAAERGWRADASALLVRRPKPEPPVTRHYDPKRLARAIAQLEPRDRVVAEVALATGMRASELRAMDVSWIRWHQQRIVIPAGVTKAQRERALPLHVRLRQVLRAWLGRRTSGPVFPPLRTHGNGPALGRDMRVVAAKLRKIAGGAVATGLHDLRHAYLSGLGAHGLPVDEVRDLAGHASIVVTERYMHSAPGRLDRARRLLDRTRVDTRVDTRKRRAGAER